MPQTRTEIRALLERAGLRPQKMFGQNFLIDQNLLARLVALADPRPGEAILEVGPGTGVLTEPLLAAGATVLAVEVDRGMARLLAERFAGEANLHLLHADVLAGKHAIAPQVLRRLADLAGEGPPAAKLVSNLPYSIATPLVSECLRLSLLSQRGQAPQGVPPVRFTSLTFTVQREVADRFAARPDDEAYGPVSVLVALLGACTQGPLAPPEAFWPRPTVTSRMMRIDVRPPAPDHLPDLDVLQRVLTAAFSQRRKRLGTAGRRSGGAFTPEAFAAALTAAGVDPDARAEHVSPEAFARVAAILSRGDGV